MGPRDGVRVVELAGIGPAPMACRLVAILGAEVLRVEPVGRGRSTTASPVTGRAWPSTSIRKFDCAYGLPGA